MHLKNGDTHLKEIKYMVTIYIDHKNLEYFMNVQILNCCKTIWNMIFNHWVDASYGGSISIEITLLPSPYMIL
jgi:hypothetical protein